MVSENRQYRKKLDKKLEKKLGLKIEYINSEKNVYGENIQKRF